MKIFTTVCTADKADATVVSFVLVPVLFAINHV